MGAFAREFSSSSECARCVLLRTDLRGFAHLLPSLESSRPSSIVVTPVRPYASA
jgi:hypothetical protein